MSNHNIQNMVSISVSLGGNNAEKVLVGIDNVIRSKFVCGVPVEEKSHEYIFFHAIFVYRVETSWSYLDEAVEIYLDPYYTPKL